MKLKLRAITLFSALMLTACSNPIDLIKKDAETEPIYELVPATTLKENTFYVKNEDTFYKLYMGETNIDSKYLIAKESDPSRVLSFTKDDVMVPTMYKDDSLIYYTRSSIPSFTWERFKDHGYTVGLYNLNAAESGKVQFVVGESKTDHGSASYTGLSQLPIEDAVIIIDKVGGQSLATSRLSECGSINGLKADEMANIDLYIGTEHHMITSTVDTHILSSMELYETNEYNLLPEGYASVKIPDYLMSGYYLINGIGVVRYVANDRSEGIANIDFSVPYFYKDEKGKQYTFDEWNKLTRENTDTEEKIADYKFTYDIDATVKTLNISISYELEEGEDVNSLQYIEPSATITSPMGEVVEFEKGSNAEHEKLEATVEGVVSGTWTIDVYDFEKRKFTVNYAVETGNADSFVHSGKTGKFTVYSDGISGPATAKIKWENATRAANVVIKSPSGITCSDTANPEQLISDRYGEKEFYLDGVEAGTWELTITGENLGRCWFNITKQEPIEESVTEDTNAAETTSLDNHSEEPA